MSKEQKYYRNDDVIVTEMDGSLMMMSVEEGKYFELNPVSKRIWEILETPSTLSDIIDVLLNEYEVSIDQCESEVATHLELLINNRIAYKA